MLGKASALLAFVFPESFLVSDFQLEREWDVSRISVARQVIEAETFIEVKLIYIN